MPSTNKLVRKVTLTLCRCLAILLLVFCGIFTSSIWANGNSHATEGVATASQDINVNLGSSLLLRILDSTATESVSELVLDMTPTALGTTVSDSVVVDVATSNSMGYKLYMNSDFTDSGTYTTNLVGVSGAIPTSTTLKNAWNYGTSWNETISSETHSGSTTNQVIPAHDSPVTLRDDVTVATNSSQTTVTFNVNADTTIPAGTYANKLLFSAVATNSMFGFNLYFNNNGGTGGPDALSVSSTGSSYTFTIPDTEPTMEGYTFKGWAETAGAAAATYLPGDTYTVIADGIPPYSKTLYAVYSNAPETTFWDISYMQEMTTDICNSVYTPSNVIGSNANVVTLVTDNVGTIPGAKATIAVHNMAEYQNLVSGNNQPYVAQRTLYDIRDNNSYTIRKLADGNCWMTSNLKLKLTANTAVVASKNDGSTFSYNPGAACANNGACAINGNTPSTGGYYSWYAATAGQGTSSSTGDVDGSICPKGWKLPYNYTVSNNKSYQELINKYSATSYTALEAAPLSFSRSGYYYSGSLGSSGSGGYYWSSTASSATYAYNLRYYASAVLPQFEDYKYYGFSVRCVAL